MHARFAYKILPLLLTIGLLLTSAALGINAQDSRSPTMQTGVANAVASSSVLFNKNLGPLDSSAFMQPAHDSHINTQPHSSYPMPLYQRNETDPVLIDEQSQTVAPTENNGNIEFLDHIGGSIYTVAVDGDLLYAGIGGELVVFNISNPESPIWLDSIILQGYVEDIFVVDTTVYVAGGTLNIVDVSNPTDITLISRFDSDAAYSVWVVNHTVYLVDIYEGLQILDAYDLINPILLGTYNVAVEGLGDVAVSGNYAFITNGYQGIRIIDIAEPLNPSQVALIDGIGFVRESVIRGDYIYVATTVVAAAAGLHVIDISDISRPVKVGFHATTGDAMALDVIDNLAYVATYYDGGVEIIDISDPTSPIELGNYHTSGAAYDVAIYGSNAFIADAGAMRVVDVSVPELLTEVFTYEAIVTGYEVEISGGYAYVYNDLGGWSGKLWIVDISTPENLKMLSSFSLPEERNIIDVAISGTFVYVVAYQSYGASGVYVLDVSDPRSPIVIAHPIIEQTQEFDLIDNYAYVRSWSGYVSIYDISNPHNFINVGRFGYVGYGHIEIIDEYAFVIGSGTTVLDVSNPISPVPVASLEYSITEIKIYGDYLLLGISNGGTPNGLVIIDFTDPTNPSEIAFFPTIASVLDVAVDGTRIFISIGDASLLVLDMSNAREPRQIAHFTHFAPYHLAYRDGVVFSASGGGGMTSLRYTGPIRPPLVVVHGIQLFGDGYRCTDTPQLYPVAPSTLGDLPGWFTQEYEVWIAHLNSRPIRTPSIETNAECLRKQVAALYETSGHQKITIVAHSMGGLVTRGCLALPDCRDKVRAVYTLGSPHAGFNSALVGKILIKLGETYLKAHGLPIPVGEGICLWQAAVCQMSVEEMILFNGNPANANQASIRYTFIGGDRSPATYGLGWLTSLTDGPHDGLVGRSSAVGWVYPFNRPAPWDWTGGADPKNMARYWTDEVHIGSWGNAYYENRDKSDGGSSENRSQSYACIQYQMGKIARPDFCRDPLAVQQTRASADVSTLSQTTASVSDQVSTGQTVTHTLSVDTATASLFTLAWSDGIVDFSLLRPDGQAITPAYAAAHPDEVAFTSAASSPEFPAFASYAFTSTLAGDWQLQITGTDVGNSPAGYVGFVAMETARALTVSQDRTLYGVGDTATFTATLQGGAGGIVGATVTASLNRPDGITETLPLADVGGGVYRTNYTVPNAGGRVVMSVIAAGSDTGVPFTRQEERIWTIAPDTAQFTGVAADRGIDGDGNGRFESLRVDVRVNVTQPATYTLSARLAKGGVSIASTAVYSEIAAAGVYTLTLSFDGSDIWAAQQDGPYTVSDAVLNNISIGSVPVASAATLHTTAAYAATDFAPDMPPLTLAIDGPTVGVVGSSYLFTATTSPITTTVPLTYTWQASGQSQIVHSASRTDTVTYTWNTIGAQTIEVAANNSAGIVTTTHTITIGEAPTSTPTPTPTETPTATPTSTLTPTATATNTRTTTPSPTLTPVPTGTGTQTATPSPTLTITPNVTQTPTTTATATPTPTATPTGPAQTEWRVYLPGIRR
ncbi:MAG: hypothetical protein KF753_18080 [Caldilineaceae bacterium]|nr:hypothetical protein [Caldilineaceae bacterium]